MGRFKARVFAALGFDEISADVFVAEIRRIALEGEVSEVEDTEFGQKYTVPGDLKGPAEGVEVEFIRTSGHTKALVTLKPTDLRAVAESDILAVRAP